MNNIDKDYVTYNEISLNIESQKLLNENSISSTEYEKLVSDFETHLNDEFNKEYLINNFNKF